MICRPSEYSKGYTKATQIKKRFRLLKYQFGSIYADSDQKTAWL